MTFCNHKRGGNEVWRVGKQPAEERMVGIRAVRERY